MIRTVLFPSKYVQGVNAIERLDDEISRLGSKGFILTDKAVTACIKKIVSSSEFKSSVIMEEFNGLCTEDELDRLQSLTEGSDCVIGIGGGAAIDTARILSYRIGAAQIIIPSIASTDAPCSGVAPIRSKEGHIIKVVNAGKNPDVVLVDTRMIAEAPVRLLVSGMGDSLSTWFEAESCYQSNVPNGNTGGDYIAMTTMTLARLCFDTLMNYGLAAKNACKVNAVIPALEHVVEANSLLSSIGFESGGLASSHAIENGLASYGTLHKNFFHGELVAFGVIASLLLIDKPRELIDQVLRFCESVGLPTTFEDLGLKGIDDEGIMKIAEVSASVPFASHEPIDVTKESIFWALKAADTEGQHSKSKKLL